MNKKAKKTKKENNKKTSLNILSPKMQNKLGLLFLTPWLIGFFIFTAIPFFITIYLSFANVQQNVTGFDITFTGWDNYFLALFQNLEFTPALVSYIGMLLIYSPTIIIISFILAYFLNSNIKFRSVFRTIYFLPVIVLSGPVMYQVMDTGSSKSAISLDNIFAFRIINYYSTSVSNIILVLFTNFAIILWFTGIPIVLFINALQKINPSLFEAAKIDSASSWQILFKIILPIIRPMGLIVAIFTISQLGIFAINPVFSLIEKSVSNTSNGLGVAAAYAWIYSLVTLIIIGIAFLIFKEPKYKHREG